MKYVLETKNLTKSYKNFVALSSFNMHVPKGSIYGFVGRNGAGKTTLIRLICGLQEPTEGSYTIFGVENNDPRINRSRRRMGAVVETPAIYLDMSAKDNIRQQYLILGLPSENGIEELLKLVGLENVGKKKVKDFSLGMRQRLGIAIALVGNPDFLILDEPINGLDPQGIIEMRELILKLNQEYGITVVISSHILDELSRLATHYGFIEQGQMIKEMSSSELEKKCRKCIQIEVNDTKKLIYALDKMNAEYSIIDDYHANIYNIIPISELILKLSNEKCEVLTIKELDESLESFYMNLIGGGHHE